MDNKTLLRKADIALADLATSGGELSATEGANFIRKLIKQPTLLQQVRTVEMTGPKMKINKIGFGQRILRKAVSATALTQSQRAKPTTEQIELDSKEQIAEVRLPYDVLENSIEAAEAANNEASNTGPGGLRQTLIDLIAERAALDMEELALLADTAYINAGDIDDEDFLSQMDGYLKLAATSGNVVDAGGQSTTKSVFKAGMKILPKEYLRNITTMKHLMSTNNVVDYIDTLSDRATELGDRAITERLSARAYGGLVEAVQLMPDDKGLFTNPLNLIFGIQRRVSMEYDKDISARTYIIVLTVRLDAQIEEDDATVYYENLVTAA